MSDANHLNNISHALKALLKGIENNDGNSLVAFEEALAKARLDHINEEIDHSAYQNYHRVVPNSLNFTVLNRWCKSSTKAKRGTTWNSHVFIGRDKKPHRVIYTFADKSIAILFKLTFG